MATLRQHCPDCRGLARARSSIDAMKVLAAPSPTPAPTGRLREWNGGVPGHGEFVMLKTQPTDGSAPLEFSSKFGSRLWMSPDDELPPTVSGEACTLRQLIRQGTFPDTGTGCSHIARPNAAGSQVAWPRDDRVPRKDRAAGPCTLWSGSVRHVRALRVRPAGEWLPRDEPLRGGNGLDPLADLLR